MKITVEQEKPVYKPITITLETAQEYFSLLAALGAGTYSAEVKKLREMNIATTSNYISPSTDLYELLFSYFNQVKETL